MSPTRTDKILGAVLVGLIGVAVVGGLVQAIRGEGEGSSMLLGHGSVAPPFFAVRMSDHQPIHAEDLKGKVVVLDFWGTWCPHCRDEAPAVRDIAREYEGRGVVVLAMDWAFEGGPEPEQEIGTFVKEAGVEGYPVVFPDSPTIANYRVQAFPTVYVIGKDGVIHYGRNGEVPARALRAQIDEALRG